MICPTCNAWTRTLETREKPGHTTYRRYECANGHSIKTEPHVRFAYRGQQTWVCTGCTNTFKEENLPRYCYTYP